MHVDRRVWLLVSSSLLLAACGGGGTAPAPVDPGPQTQRTPAERLALKTFRADCSDFLDYAADALTEQFLTPVFCATLVGAPCPVFAAEGPPPPGAMPTPMPTPAATAAPGVGAPGLDSEGGGDPDRGSGTNTQEEGVDEADIVKADAAGNLYVLANNKLSIVDAYPPQNLDQAAMATLDFSAVENGAFYATEFFLDETADRAVVLGSTYRFDGTNGSPQSVALIIDVADPRDPVMLGRLGVDGSPMVVRRIGERVHRVSRYDVAAPAWFYGDSELAQLRDDYYDAQSRSDEAAVARIKSEVRAEIGNRVRATGADAFLPRIRGADDGSGAGEVLACDAIAHPEVATALGLMVVDSFDTDGGDHAASGVINNAFTVYASVANLYMVQSSWGWFFAPNQTEETAIYRLALPDSGAAAYQAIGKLDGTVNNSYQLSEFDGHLRVASTEFRFDDQTQRSRPVNHITILDAEAAGTMAKTGEIRDLAPDETIQGSRFIGARGFVVTFERIDPLFALDLSDPAAPRIADELKIPGFSSYLMPLGDNYLLTIGRDGTDEGLTGKVAVQLFDVTDLGNISQIAVLTPDSGESGSYSAAEYDPHAFTYFSDTADAPVPGTLSIPLQAYGERWDDSFSGFLVLRVDPVAGTPLRELGRVDHSGLVSAPDDCQPPPSAEPRTTPAPGAATPCEYWYGSQADPLRSVFLEDALGRTLYTISRAGVIAGDAQQPSTVYGSRLLP